MWQSTFPISSPAAARFSAALILNVASLAWAARAGRSDAIRRVGCSFSLGQGAVSVDVVEHAVADSLEVFVGQWLVGSGEVLIQAPTGDAPQRGHE